MSNRSHKTARHLSNEPSLFDTSLPEGAFDILLGLKQCMSRTMSASSKDRYQIVAEISRYLGRCVTKDSLDKMVSSDPAYRPDADFLTSFCYVVGTMEPFSYLLHPLDADVLHPEDKDLVKLARLTEQRLVIDSEIMQLRTKRGLK